jgi:hypothetical protein
LILGGIST